MKRTTKIILTRNRWNYCMPDGSIGLCKGFVNKIVKDEPHQIEVSVRAIPPTKTQTGYMVGRRSKICDYYVSLGKRGAYTYHYDTVRGTLEDLRVKRGDKFWFRITAKKK